MSSLTLKTGGWTFTSRDMIAVSYARMHAMVAVHVMCGVYCNMPSQLIVAVYILHVSDSIIQLSRIT